VVVLQICRGDVRRRLARRHFLAKARRIAPLLSRRVFRPFAHAQLVSDRREPPPLKYVVNFNEDGKRARRFFEAKKEAETFSRHCSMPELVN
jgi:hypothetical protein